MSEKSSFLDIFEYNFSMKFIYVERLEPSPSIWFIIKTMQNSDSLQLVRAYSFKGKNKFDPYFLNK